MYLGPEATPEQVELATLVLPLRRGFIDIA